MFKKFGKKIWWEFEVFIAEAPLRRRTNCRNYQLGRHEAVKVTNALGRIS